MTVMNQRIESIAARAYAHRQSVISDLYSDPFIGYDTIEDATDDCRGSSQVEVMARLLRRENVFVSGPAGSGKTTIIKRFISMIEATYNGNFNIAVTASTGLAATLIEGRTIHSWSGLGIFDGVLDNAKLRNAKAHGLNTQRTVSAIKYVDVLIIDEISMLHAYYLDNLDTLFKFARRSKEPFGGVQVIFLGDFMQLPPVPPRNPKDDVNYDYAITSQAWKDADIQYCYMDKVHRAEDDELKHLLKTIEMSNVDKDSHKVINKCLSNVRDKSKSYTTLFTTNRNVDKYNQEQLDANPGKLVSYHARKITGTDAAIEKLSKDRKIIDVLHLKVGATVIVTSNISLVFGSSLSIANGTVGKVVELFADSVHVRLNNGKVSVIERVVQTDTKKTHYTSPITNKTVTVVETVAEIAQMPLKLGYAITVHKSQGQTFDGVEVDLSNCFTPGLGYVALSRVRSSDNLIITNFTEKSLQVGERSKKISTFVKKKAVMSRRAFLADLSGYVPLLDDRLSLDIHWDEDNSGAIRLGRSQEQKF